MSIFGVDSHVAWNLLLLSVFITWVIWLNRTRYSTCCNATVTYNEGWGRYYCDECHQRCKLL